MIAKNRIAISLSHNWLLFSVLAVMVLSGLYLVLYILTGFLWTPSNLHYWLVFPYSETYWTAISAGFLFAFCGAILISKSKKATQSFFKIPLAISWPILSACVLLVVIGCLLLFSDSVDRLDSADYQQHTIHLAFENNNESGFSYYLVDCDHHSFQCKMLARFFPHDLIMWADDARLSRLHISDSGLVTVVTHNEQVIYQYTLPPK